MQIYKKNQKGSTFLLSIFFLLFIAQASCKNKDNEKSILNSVITVDLSFSKENYNEASLASFADSIWHVTLEENDSVFLSKKLSVFNKKEKIYILDNSFGQVYVYSQTGRLIRRIGKKGDAPYEYKNPTSLVVNSFGDIIVLDNSGRKLIFYDSVGNYNKYIPLTDNYPVKVFLFNDNQILLCSPSNGKTDDHIPEFVTIDTNGKRTGLLNIEGKYLQRRLLNASYSVFDDSLSFWQKSNDTLFHISNNLVLTPTHVLFDKDLMPKEKMLMEEDRHLKDFSVIDGLYETDSFIIIHGIAFRNIPLYMIYEKNTNKIFNVRSGVKSFPIAFTNDLDHGPPFWPTGQINKNIFYSVVNSSVFLEMYKESKKSGLKIVNNKHLDNVLEAFISTVPNDESLILTFVKFK